MSKDYTRPPGASDDLVAAAGKVSEAMEYVERVRGKLYDLHQLMGHADLLFGDAADELAAAGAPEQAKKLRDEVVGRNIIEGRWTFQLVDEFNEHYYSVVKKSVEQIENDLMDGKQHVYEAEMKEERRTKHREGHQRKP